MAQLLGFVLLFVALAVAAGSPVPLFVCGVLLVVVPEIAAVVRRGDKAAKR